MPRHPTRVSQSSVEHQEGSAAAALQYLGADAIYVNELLGVPLSCRHVILASVAVSDDL